MAAASTILAMNSMPVGSHVFFWDTRGQVIKGVIQSTTRTAEGSLMVVINSDAGRTITLPVAAVTLDPNPS
ncbi:uncharacterized protein BT62DRAFT_999046 [Guyanagaster necrorhizus]|uniref:Uncharacterized protein n=1 Tax=Guyanagaster necrorhizus TaxID=856835 RepID=A0A9P7W5U2_9AGAR|nr:uncharacterized protein BT62DRAFT_999046 [Guyanagaster necrorhizus MCA 3950]KAG7453010.1 hypothetical protein BT62DRAFT_999046 [Guyanagaster necrorhizus MCA 3950]